MDLSAQALMASLLVSTIGFSLFLYGKKQKRLPQFLGGIAMMAAPYFVPGAGWVYVAGGLCTGAVWAACRAGV